MVLSYMEDHLKNKQRLEQEWVGLCAYEAEPNSTAIAFKVENKKKNRYPDKLPYDHNRVLLNALSNGTNSDYINASTVMDHDPRNPAYIVTQGPMAHTVADFWQMVWEQGSVVLVMLSRLSENGYQLAHRYWPEEGSEQYHIFEVHLVSEHVWCDDYLVRSLYLKNSQTGETRTVTQFHFLSWADGTIPTSTRAILNNDSALTDHANNHLGINIKGFEAGGKEEAVTRVSTGHDRSRLLLLVLLGSLTLAAIGAALGLFLMLRRRGKKIGGGVEENREPEKEEPVKEYKQLVRDWSRSSRASQGSVSNGAKGENGQDSPLAGKRVHKISGGQNSEGSRTSSTSSWQEEPSATAMDISTGHMVLSYMEDHLKN